MRADGAHQRVIVRGGPDSFYNNPPSLPDGTRVSYANWLRLPDAANAESSETWAAWATGNAPAPAHQPRVRQQARLGTPA